MACAATVEPGCIGKFGTPFASSVIGRQEHLRLGWFGDGEVGVPSEGGRNIHRTVGIDLGGHAKGGAAIDRGKFPRHAQGVLEGERAHQARMLGPRDAGASRRIAKPLDAPLIPSKQQTVDRQSVAIALQVGLEGEVHLATRRGEAVGSKPIGVGIEQRNAARARRLQEGLARGRQRKQFARAKSPAGGHAAGLRLDGEVGAVGSKGEGGVAWQVRGHGAA
jgi:hypothetical protein